MKCDWEHFREHIKKNIMGTPWELNGNRVGFFLKIKNKNRHYVDKWHPEQTLKP